MTKFRNTPHPPLWMPFSVSRSLFYKESNIIFGNKQTGGGGGGGVVGAWKCLVSCHTSWIRYEAEMWLDVACRCILRCLDGVVEPWKGITWPHLRHLGLLPPPPSWHTPKVLAEVIQSVHPSSRKNDSNNRKVKKKNDDEKVVSGDRKKM